MQEIKINFVDFWPDLIKTDNYFYNLLSEQYKVVIDDNPELLFYSCFGNEYLTYNCKRIYYTGENLRPDFTGCDFAFTFDFSKNKKHYRLPLFLLIIEENNAIAALETIKTREEFIAAWNQKTKFCCMVVSNARAKKRLDFFKKLSQYKTVDSGGKVFNNVGGRVKDKIAFIKDYKFVLSFENEAHDGYTTEKILQPILVDSIPIYWGNKKVYKDFNTKRFINHSDFETEKQLIERLLAIETNPELAVEMLMQPVFSQERVRYEDERKAIFYLINSVIQSEKPPIASTYFKKIHFYKVKMRRVKPVLFRWYRKFFNSKLGA